MWRNHSIFVGLIGVVVCLSGYGESIDRVESLPSYKKMTVTERIETYIDSEKVDARYHSNYGYDRYALNDSFLRDRDFDAVTKRANELFDEIEARYGEQEYDIFISALGYLPDDVSAEKYEQVIREWIEVDQENWLPYLVRGEFFISRGWEARGGGYINTVSEEHIREFSQYMNKARRDLERAYALNPNDPSSSISLMWIATGLGEDVEVRKAYDKAIASLPTSLDARKNVLTYLLPQWGGTWEAMKAFVGEEMKDFENNSILVELQNSLIRYRYRFEDGSKKIYEDMELAREMIEKYRVAQERYPQSYSLKKGWFDWARRAKDYEEQYLASVAIGDTWRPSVMHRSAESYHFSRMVALRNYAKTTQGEERDRLYAELLEVSHGWPWPWVDMAKKAFTDGDSELGYEYSEKAAQLGTDEWWIYRGLIGIAMRDGRYEDALKYLDRAEAMPIGTRNRQQRETDLKLWEKYRTAALKHVSVE